LAGEGKTRNCAVPDTKRFSEGNCNPVQKVYRKLGLDESVLFCYNTGRFEKGDENVKKTNVQELIDSTGRPVFILSEGYYKSDDVKSALRDIFSRSHVDGLTKADHLLLTILEHNMYIPS
jgi:hypothetical protein